MNDFDRIYQDLKRKQAEAHEPVSLFALYIQTDYEGENQKEGET